MGVGRIALTRPLLVCGRAEAEANQKWEQPGRSAWTFPSSGGALGAAKSLLSFPGSRQSCLVNSAIVVAVRNRPLARERGVVDPRLDSPPQSHVTSGRQCDSGAPLYLSGVGQNAKEYPKISF